MAVNKQQQDFAADAAVPTSDLPTSDGAIKSPETIATRPGPMQSNQSTGDVLPPGRMLGQYRILERLGAGGMGQVYKAMHLVMDRVVALKIISPRLMQEPVVCARFQREVRNAARLIHPHIVVAHDAAQAEGMWFLVMEYIEGRDVARLMMQEGRPPLALACEIVRQAALGLQYAYERGMVHRDIKPANLMVTQARPPAPGPSATGWPDAPLVKILDFGLARLSAADGVGLESSEGLTREGHVVGTPEYMAPEQARDSRKVDIRSDIYALGCTLYALLAGRPPFKAPSTFELAVMHLTEKPEPVARYHPGLPVELSALVHRLLAKNPDERLQTPGEVASALQPWAQSTVPVPNTPPRDATPSIVSSSPVATTALPAPPRPVYREPEVPPDVMIMHFHALLRTFLLVLIITVIGAGCVLYLPEIGNHLLQLWNRVTPQPTKMAPSP